MPPPALTLTDILDDLCSRFLVNIPHSGRNNTVRICFEVEKAHWHYLDFYRQRDTSLPKFEPKPFLKAIFQHWVPFQALVKDVDTIFDEWKAYKHTVPTCGCIMLNSECNQVLLVKSFGKGGSWGFPKGKMNQGEAFVDCACRETLEETSYDCSPLAKPNDLLEMVLGKSGPPADRRKTTLFIVVGVSEDFDFKPQTRNEISEIMWHDLASLPRNKNDPGASGYWGVYNVTHKIYDWLKSSRGHKVRKAAMQAAGFKPRQIKDVGEAINAVAVKSAATVMTDCDPHTAGHDGEARLEAPGIFVLPGTKEVGTAGAISGDSSTLELGRSLVQMLMRSTSTAVTQPRVQTPADGASLLAMLKGGNTAGGNAAEPAPKKAKKAKRGKAVNGDSTIKGGEVAKAKAAVAKPITIAVNPKWKVSPDTGVTEPPGSDVPNHVDVDTADWSARPFSNFFFERKFILSAFG